MKREASYFNGFDRSIDEVGVVERTQKFGMRSIKKESKVVIPVEQRGKNQTFWASVESMAGKGKTNVYLNFDV